MAHNYSPTQHRSDRPEVMLVDDFRFIWTEKLVLELLRYFCMSYAEPQSQSWCQAFKHAEKTTGNVYGPAVAFGVSELLTSLRRERVTPFDFVRPCCAKCATKILSTEASLMMLVRGARVNDSIMISSHAKYILDRNEGRNTIASAYALGTCLSCISPRGETDLGSFPMHSGAIH